jgi:hypothetical protein
MAVAEVNEKSSLLVRESQQFRKANFLNTKILTLIF